jgi:hypothetical protein
MQGVVEDDQQGRKPSQVIDAYEVARIGTLHSCVESSAADPGTAEDLRRARIIGATT